MEIGGIVIAAIFVALLATVPSLVARRSAIAQSREIDRFSPRLRIIRANEPELDTCDHASGTLLARRAMMSGESMHQTTAGRTRPVIDRRNNQAIRDIAKLRARRAARLAAESAAGRRRMVISGICALATLTLGIVIAASSLLSAAWISIPAAALAASLGASRVAAVRSQRASEHEMVLLTKLRGDVRRGGRSAAAPGAQTRHQGAHESHEDEAREATPHASSERATTGEPQTGTSRSLVFNVEVPEVVEVADTPARAWTVAPIPAPTYASRERIRGRIVHADTDLRGIPRIDAVVPARPIAPTAQAGARSTAEVVADQAVALDLDAVLDARRAQ
ncbi:hypothetical protein ADJ76_00275 [Schaalia meyeri]|uniref:hypothetical protein n=1 Tax=Schaalia meyeri TaxID=52773 RepID=UPI00067FCFF2|nr:hypothetical protein [Schaalia meyeri]AKU64408.1 hypothetical protein ADJ76_00275 [Schaalia meyeri]